MMKAKYSPECVGHFGLASKYYCHFTSPIRRYPDLMIHRIIKEVINGGLSEARNERLTKEVEIASKQSSDMERVAMEAERDVDDLKKAEYMSDRIGEEYDGIISSVTNFGLFIELPNTIEGLVHMTSLDDDYYVFDERHLTLVGERTKKTYRLGEEVRIIVSKVDLATHEVYFDFVEKEDEEEKEENIDENHKENEDEKEYTVRDLNELISDDVAK
jgi:ribonuclease R